MKMTAFATLFLLLGAFPRPAPAAEGAHFFHTTTDSIAANGALVVTIDEAGVGQLDVSYSVTISLATATYGCINNGDNHPKAANKETVSSSVSLPLGTFSPVNGRIRVTVSLNGTPLPAGNFSCPNGQTLVLGSVSYSGVTLLDQTNGISIGLPDVSRTLVNF
jgi:hypothetical protein